MWEKVNPENSDRNGFRPFSREMGVTLIELMVVLAIMAVVTAIVAPRFAGTRSTELKTATRKAVQALRYTRSQSVSTGLVFEAKVDFEKSRLLVIPVSGEKKHPAQGMQAEIPLPGLKEKSLDLPKGVWFTQEKENAPGGGTTPSAGPLVIRFFPGGNSTGGRFYITNGKGIFSVEINFITADVTMDALL